MHGITLPDINGTLLDNEIFLLIYDAATGTWIESFYPNLAMCVWLTGGTLGKFSNHLSKSSIKSSTLTLQTAWTVFDPYLYSSGSSSKPVQAVCREKVEFLIELFGRWFENSPRNHCPHPLVHFFREGSWCTS